MKNKFFFCCILFLLFAKLDASLPNSKDLKFFYEICNMKGELFFQNKEEVELDEQVQRLTDELYQNIIKLTALYYFQNVTNSSYMFDQSLVLVIIKDLKDLIKLLTLYIPKLLKDNTVSWKQKLKKICYISAILGVITVWLKRYFFNKQNRFDLLENDLFGFYNYTRELEDANSKVLF